MGSTSALRGVILAAAVLIGIYGLANAFPEKGLSAVVAGSGGNAHGTPSSSTTTTTPPKTTSPSPHKSKKPLTRNVTVQVLNGSGRAGLAANTTTTIQNKNLGFTMMTPGNAPSHASTTTIYYKAGLQASAQYLASKVFANALIKESTNAGFTADLTVWLGTDFSA
jgi:LytR cell envelope-related transcriptional attenuator